MHLLCKISESRNEDERHHAHETILEYVQKATDDIQWEIDKREFDEMIAAKRESSPGPESIPYGIYRCASGLEVSLLVQCKKRMLEGGVVPTHFAASRTVFIPKYSTVDDNGLIVRSLDVLRC